ncbi:MAG: glycosyltransferase family 2 protein [Pseudomonadota bacterium]
MKLIIQIPCLNEAETLPQVLLNLPKSIPGITTIETLVIDDGSSDNTSQVAKAWGVNHIVRHRRNRGLAAAFCSGLDTALRAGADIIVNTDADNQYDSSSIADLVAPVVAGKADIVIGDRKPGENKHFKPFKRLLQRIGSAVVARLSKTDITDAVSGFRAISREAAQRIVIVSDFSYTTEMLIQAGRNRMAIVSVPIKTNSATRPSRLFSNIPQFIANTGVTMARAYAMYNPLRVFTTFGAVLALIGLLPIVRFIVQYLVADGSGKIQSLVLGGALVTLGVISILLGLVADLVGRNRQLLETTLERLNRIEDAVADSNAEPNSVAADGCDPIEERKAS